MTDNSYGVATDSQNNVIVTGYSGTNYLIIKYDSNGNLLWPTAVIGPSGIPHDVATDFQNNILVTGDNGTIKYGPNGNFIWDKPYPGTADAVATDSQNNIIVAGDSGTIKYDSNGNLLRQVDYLGTVYDVAVDSQNNNVVTGAPTSDYLHCKI